MAIKHTRDAIRLVILTFFLSSNAIILIHALVTTGRFRPGVPAFSPLVTLIISMVFIFWYLLELWEYFRHVYSRPGTRTGYLLFLVRVLPFIAAILLIPDSVHILMPMFLVVLIFYSVVVMPNWISFFFLFTGLFLQIVLAVYIPDPFRPPRRETGSIDLMFILYKIMNLLLIWLISYFLKRNRLQWHENEVLTRDLHRANRKLESYAVQVADAVVLEERTRLARDIHDSVGHTLTAASIQLAKAETYFSKDSAVSLASIKAARGCVREGLQDVREVIGPLRDDNGGIQLFARIRDLLSRVEPGPYTVDARLDGNQDRFNRAVLLAIFRFVQEGLTNILKHAAADSITIRVELKPEKAVLLLSDNGCGMDPATAAAGTGLRGLRERIALVRGTFQVDTAPGQGTRLSAVIPREPASLIGGEERES